MLEGPDYSFRGLQWGLALSTGRSLAQGVGGEVYIRDVYSMRGNRSLESPKAWEEGCEFDQRIGR
jgi:hypothetical protein